MGVELGKVLAKKILAQLDKPEDVVGHDSSVCLHFPLVIVLMQRFRPLALFIITRSLGKSKELERGGFCLL